MAKCFNVCCDDLEGVTKSDLDRFTDRIEHLLSNEHGRRLFRNFMITTKMQDGKKSLAFWERCETMLTSPPLSSENARMDDRFLERFNSLIDDADRVEELDFVAIERLMTVRDEMPAGNKEAVRTAVKTLQNELKKTLVQEYDAFKKHYVNKFT